MTLGDAFFEWFIIQFRGKMECHIHQASYGRIHHQDPDIKKWSGI